VPDEWVAPTAEERTRWAKYGAPSVEDRERWQRWAADRARRKPTAEPHDADWHARAIRRAIADAQGDGMVVDFNWTGQLRTSNVHLAVVHKDVNWSKAVQIWPMPFEGAAGGV
jgi:hypothetical protein